VPDRLFRHDRLRPPILQKAHDKPDCRCHIT
jgi:hypothetical protein